MAQQRFRRSGDRRQDEGAALAIALIFLLVVGILVTAALNKSGAVMTTNYSVREQAQLQYAADAGIDRALARLRDGVPDGINAICAQPPAAGDPNPDTDMTSSGPDSGGLKINVNLTDNQSPHAQLRARYKCRTVAGAVPGLNNTTTTGYSIVTTGGNATDGGSSTLSSEEGTGKNLLVNGSIYLAGPDQAAVFKKPIQLAGSVVEFDQGKLKTCLTDVSALTPGSISDASGNAVPTTCGAQRPIDAIAETDLPSNAPGAAPPYISYPSPAKETCRVFLPGKYTTPPALLGFSGSGAPEANYFVSGRYYFADFGPWSITKAIVIGGQPNTGDYSPADGVASATGCSDFSGTPDDVYTLLQTIKPGGLGLPAGAQWKEGTQFIFGGSSSVVLKNATVTLYTPPNAKLNPTETPQPALSFLAARSDQWFAPGSTTKDTDRNYQPWNGGATPVIGTDSTNNVEFTSNSGFMAPDAPVSLAGTKKTVLELRGGLVGKTVNVAASGSISDAIEFDPPGGSTGPGPSPQRRTVNITACVDPDPSVNCLMTPTPRTLTDVATATIDNFGTRPVRVFTWRTA